MSTPNPFSVEHITPGLTVILEENPHKIQFPEGYVDEVFENARKKKPLFNGTLVCVKNFTPQHITSYTISFKEFLASYQLGYNRIHHPLAVSGWIKHRGNLLFGVRSEKVLFSPLKLELVPSGGIDESAIEGQNINFEYALLNEFEQETGMFIDDIIEIRPELMVLCNEKNIFDICMSITLDDENDVQCDHSNDEYKEFLWVPLKDLKNFVNRNKSKLHPTTLAIIQSKLLL